MSAPEGEANDVLASLPRSRRQRPTARREAARAKKAGASKASSRPKRATAKGAAATGAGAGPKTAKGTVAKPRASASASAKPAGKRPLTPSAKRTSDLPRVRPPRSAIPPAGYATPSTDRGDHGTADPGAALGRLAGAGASALRGVLRRLPL